MAALNDAFAGTSGSTITGHTSDSGHTWADHAPYAGSGQIVISNANRVRHVTTGSPVTHAVRSSYVAPSNGYDLEFDIYCVTNVGSAGVGFRYVSGADSGYLFRVSGTAWGLLRLDSGSPTTLASDTLSPTAATSYHIKLEVRAGSLAAYRGGVQIGSTSTDTTYPGVGVIIMRFTNTSMTDSTGYHLDNVQITQEIASSSSPSKGSQAVPLLLS